MPRGAYRNGSVDRVEGELRACPEDINGRGKGREQGLARRLVLAAVRLRGAAAEDAHEGRQPRVALQGQGERDEICMVR